MKSNLAKTVLVFVMVAAAFVLTAGGCKSDGDHPKGDATKADHPTSAQPKPDHPTSEHPK